MRPPRGGGFGGRSGGGFGGRSGGGRSSGARFDGGRSSGGRFGDRFGGNSYNEGPPEEVVEVSSFVHASEGDAVTKLTNEKIPYFNAPIYLQNKTLIGKVDEIFGPFNESFFSVKMDEGIVATSYAAGDKFFIDPMKLLPLSRFLPQPKPLRPYPISKKRVIPAGIELPDWAVDGIPKIEPASDLQHVVEIKTPEQIERMRETNRIAREVLDAAARVVRPGVTTDEIDAVVHEATIAAGAYPSPLNYHFFPKSCCTSVNEVICHGIPDGRKLEDGDIVNVDVSVCYKGVHGEVQ